MRTRPAVRGEMISFGRLLTLGSTAGLCVAVASCGGGSPKTPPPPTTYTLTVNSTNPASGVQISYTEGNSNVAQTGKTSFTVTVNSGTQVELSAPPMAGDNNFSSWTGCTTASSTTCSMTVTASTTVTAGYTTPTVSSVTVTPNPASATIGGTVQFAATVSGSGVTNNSVTWSVAAPSGSSLSPGTISSSGLYTTPYPAPATVTVTATSVQDTSVSGSVTVTLSAPAAATGPVLSVDAG